MSSTPLRQALVGSFLLAALSAPLAAFAAFPQTIVFEGASAEKKWPLKDLGPDWPADLSSYQFIVMEMRASSPQRFDLEFFTPEGVRYQHIHPFQNTWVRAAIPLQYFREPPREGYDLASVHNKPHPSFWVNLGGKYGSLTHVDAMGVAMQNPVGAPTLEIRSMRLSKQDPGSIVLDPKPLVDEFGQWIPAEWPGKAHSLDDLKKAWATEAAALRPGDVHVDKYGGYLDTQAQATGFFRVEKIDGKWWFVDPDGHLFFSTGANGVSPSSGTRTQGREELFASLPPAASLGSATQAASMPATRPAAPRAVPLASFYTWNLQRRFGQDYADAWVDLTARRMDAWGLNTTNWSDARLRTRKPYILTLRSWQTGPSWLGMPDVYDPHFPQSVEQSAQRQCEVLKNDPFLVGYFIGNEPPWPGQETLLCDMILASSPCPMQTELRQFLAHGDTPAQRKAFALRAFGRYLDVINQAVKKYDPHHLNLGIRYGGAPSDDIIRAARRFDVYSHNIYRVVPDPAFIEKVAALTDRPILIGEFHFGAPGRGLASGLVQAANQEERGVAYRYYVENLAAHPSVVGAHWFQWVDQPSTGRMDGENYNIGIVDVTDRPYEEFVAAMRETHKRLLAVHSGKASPVTRKARPQ